eukprot:3045053-Rhodomonas_salina.3
MTTTRHVAGHCFSDVRFASTSMRRNFLGGSERGVRGGRGPLCSVDLLVSLFPDFLVRTITPTKKALCGLSAYFAVRKDCADAGSTLCFQGILRASEYSGDNQLEVQQVAISVLAELTAEPAPTNKVALSLADCFSTARSRAGDAGCISALAKAMSQDQQSTKIYEKAFKALTNLTHLNSRNQDRANMAGCIPAVVKVMSSCEATRIRMDRGLQVQACRALASMISGHTASCDKHGAGCIEAVMGTMMLHRQDAE